MGGHNIVIQHKLLDRHTVGITYELQREHEILHQPTQQDNSKKTRQTNETKGHTSGLQLTNSRQDFGTIPNQSTTKNIKTRPNIPNTFGI